LETSEGLPISLEESIDGNIPQMNGKYNRKMSTDEPGLTLKVGFSGELLIILEESMGEYTSK
jgi:hypothetical protein